MVARGAPDRPLRVVTFHDPPMIYVQKRLNGSATYSGYLYHLWETVADELGLRFQMVAPLTAGYGSLGSNGTWTGLVGDLAAGRADVALSWLTHTSERAAVIEYLDAVPVEVERKTFIIRRDSGGGLALSEVMFSQLLRPLHLNVWWTLIVSLLLLAMVLHVSLRFNSRRAENKRLVDEMNWSSCLLASLMTVTGQGWETTPRSLAGRITTIFGWLMGILIYINYTANLMSSLAVSTIDRPISSLREFSEKADWKLAIRPGSFKLDALKYSTDFYERKLYQRVENGDRYIPLQDINGSMRHVFQPKVMAFANIHLLDYWLGEEACHFVPLQDMSIKPSPTYMAMTKERPALKQAITRALLKLSETGAMLKLKKVLRKTSTSLCDEQRNGYKQLSLNELLSVLALVPLGIVVSLGIFGMELIMSRCHQIRATLSTRRQMSWAKGRGKEIGHIKKKRKMGYKTRSQQYSLNSASVHRSKRLYYK